MRMFEYTTVVRFSDTDCYGIVHHSNYFRWLEEARIDFLENELKITMEDMQDQHIQFPVIKIEAKYKKVVHGREKILIQFTIKYDGTSKVIFHYKIWNERKECVFIGYTEHVAINDQKLLFDLPEEFGSKIKRFLENM